MVRIKALSILSVLLCGNQNIHLKVNLYFNEIVLVMNKGEVQLSIYQSTESTDSNKNTRLAKHK